ncbi:hypothetical protein [Salicibibacter halophilus]|nr:hypothetical protein [Salicibibacter halophilus]
MEHELTFFERLPNGDYRRIDELHRQRHFDYGLYAVASSRRL